MDRIESYAFCDAPETLLYVYIPSTVTYVGMYTFIGCSEWLQIELDPDCDTSGWDPDWCMGNGDAETSFAVKGLRVYGEPAEEDAPIGSGGTNE